MIDHQAGSISAPLGFGIVGSTFGDNSPVDISLGSTASASGGIIGILGLSTGDESDVTINLRAGSTATGIVGIAGITTAASDLVINSNGTVTAVGAPIIIPGLSVGILGLATDMGDVAISTGTGGTVTADSSLGFGIVGLSNSGN